MHSSKYGDVLCNNSMQKKRQEQVWNRPLDVSKFNTWTKEVFPV